MVSRQDIKLIGASVSYVAVFGILALAVYSSNVRVFGDVLPAHALADTSERKKRS